MIHQRKHRCTRLLVFVLTLLSIMLFSISAFAKNMEREISDIMHGRSAVDSNTGEYENGSDTFIIGESTDLGMDGITTDDIIDSTSDKTTVKPPVPDAAESGRADDTADGTSVMSIVIAVAVAVAIIILIIILIPKNNKRRDD